MQYIARRTGNAVGLTVVGIAVVLLSALYIDLPQTSEFFGRHVGINKGMDLGGGARILLCAANTAHPSSSEMDIARNVINARVAGGLGIAEPQVSRVGDKCVSAELPGVSN